MRGSTVRLAVALGERDPDSLDFYAGPPDAVADVRRSPPPLTTIKRDALALSARVSAAPLADSLDRARAGDLVRDLTAMATRVDVLTGTRLPYDAESAAWFGVVPGPVDDGRLSAIRSQIADAVGGEGRLVERYASFAARFTIPADRLPAVMAAAVGECRRATAEQVTLPPGEGVTLEFVRDKPWSAFSRYAGDGRSVLQINTDFRFTVDQALQVACHEGYPGHHLRNVLQAPRRAGGVGLGSDPSPTPVRPERLVQLTFSPEGLASEAAAMVAVDVAFPAEARVRVERERLFPLAGLKPDGVEQHVAVERMVGDLQMAQADVARRYLDGALEFARAVEALEDAALVPHAEALVKYINEYRSYITTYTAGRERLAARLAACDGAAPTDTARWRCFLHETLPR